LAANCAGVTVFPFSFFASSFCDGALSFEDFFSIRRHWRERIKLYTRGFGGSATCFPFLFFDPFQGSLLFINSRCLLCRFACCGEPILILSMLRGVRRLYFFRFVSPVRFGLKGAFFASSSCLFPPIWEFCVSTRCARTDVDGRDGCIESLLHHHTSFPLLRYCCLVIFILCFFLILARGGFLSFLPNFLAYFLFPLARILVQPPSSLSTPIDPHLFSRPPSLASFERTSRSR